VVVQEYAASGFPLVLSDAVGAGEQFLQSGQNGFSFKASDVMELKHCLKKTIELSAKELSSMSQKSHALAQSNSPEKWAATRRKMYDEGKKE
jgi:glycogen synthase